MNTKLGYYHLRMKLKGFKSTIILVLATFSAWGQNSLTGRVTDSDNNALTNAEVYISELQRLENTTESGNFYFDEVPQGEYNVVIFAFGFQVREQRVEVNGNTTLNVSLDALGEQLPEVIITQHRERIFRLQQLKKVEGTAIYAGKKSEVVLMENLTGNLAANNARQIYGQVVGLNIYENGDAGLQLNIGGRGLDPNRTANFNVRQNGYDISADALGYPESYYTPPAEALSEIQVVRGAASLQYGPQFGGLVNFKFKRPNPNKEIELISRQTIGSYDLFTSFNSLSGTVGDFSYYSYFNYKQGNGFRPNTNFNSRNFYGHFGYQLTDRTKLSLETTFFNYLTKQPGGLTDNQFMEDPTFSNRERNWFNVDWKLFSLRLDHRFSSKTDFSLNLFALDASRGAIGLRTNRVDLVDDPNEPRELLVDNFKNWGAETRLLTRYKIKNQDAVFLMGAKYYQSDNDQFQGPGSASSNAEFELRDELFPDFPNQAQFTFPNLNLAFFGENIFSLSNTFSITPGFRFEYIKTQSEGSFREIVFDLAGNPLSNREIPDNRTFERSFFIFGIGASYKPSNAFELYANFSENYRSVTFNDIRITNDSQRIDEDITDETGFTADLGIRGRLKDLLSYDLSAFGLSYDNRIGEIVDPEDGVGTFRGNIGTAFIYGLEGFADVNLKSIIAPELEKLKFNYFANLALTESEYTDSEENDVEGNKVEFIPKVNLKTGLQLGYGDFLSTIQYTSISEQYTDASNSPPLFEDARNAGIIGSIPAYDILDFSISYTYKKFKLEAGINNVLDNSYFTRRATGYPGPGIIPAEPRTYYTTLQIKL